MNNLRIFLFDKVERQFLSFRTDLPEFPSSCPSILVELSYLQHHPPQPSKPWQLRCRTEDSRSETAWRPPTETDALIQLTLLKLGTWKPIPAAPVAA